MSSPTGRATRGRRAGTRRHAMPGVRTPASHRSAALRTRRQPSRRAREPGCPPAVQRRGEPLAVPCATASPSPWRARRGRHDSESAHQSTVEAPLHRVKSLDVGRVALPPSRRPVAFEHPVDRPRGEQARLELLDEIESFERAGLRDEPGGIEPRGSLPAMSSRSTAYASCAQDGATLRKSSGSSTPTAFRRRPCSGANSTTRSA